MELRVTAVPAVQRPKKWDRINHNGVVRPVGETGAMRDMGLKCTRGLKYVQFVLKCRNKYSVS